MQVSKAMHARATALVIGFAGLLALTTALVALAETAGHDRLPPEKQATLQREAEALAAAQAGLRPAKDVTKLPEARPDEPRLLPLQRTPAGAGTIVESGLAPFGSGFVVENRWYEQRGAEQLIVYAGGSRADPSQGVLAVALTTSRGGGFYPTPTKAGSVHVVAAVGERLTLISKNGATFVFDIPTRSFVTP
jgi:hypothetical protein